MRLKSRIVLSGLAVGVGLWGFAATGCQELSVPASLQNSDSTTTLGLDQPGDQGAGDGSVVPLEDGNLKLEGTSR